MADSREYRKNFIISSVAFVLILFGILISFYFLGNVLNAAKLDLTEDKIFTVSPATKDILRDLEDEIIVRYYCSEDVPSSLINLKRDTIDMFRELEALSGEKFKWEVIAPEVEARRYAEEEVKKYYEAKDAGRTPQEPAQKETFEDLFLRRGARKTDEEIRKDRQTRAEALAQHTDLTVDEQFRRLLSKDFEEAYLADLRNQEIFQIPVEERKASQTTETYFYTAIEIKYLDKTPEVISVHHRIENLEYELANKILKLTQKAKPKVVFFDGRKPEMPKFDPMNPMQRPPMSEYSGVTGALRELFDIEEIGLKEEDAISDVEKRMLEAIEKEKDAIERQSKPEKISCLIVAQPTDLEPRQVFEISKAVSEGIPAIFLVSNYSLDTSQQGQQSGIPISILRPGLDDLFRSWGVSLGREILASKECSTLIVAQRMRGLPFAVRAPYPMPVLPRASGEEINQAHPLTNRIQSLVFPACVGLNIDEEKVKREELKLTELAESGDKSYTVPIAMFEQNMFNRPQPPSIMTKPELREVRKYEGSFIDSKPLAVYIEGKLPFKFQDQQIPEWEKKPEEEEKDEDKDQSSDDADLSGLQGSQHGDLLLAQADPKPEESPAPPPPPVPEAAPKIEEPKVPLSPPEEEAVTPPAEPVIPAAPAEKGAKAEEKASPPVEKAAEPVPAKKEAGKKEKAGKAEKKEAEKAHVDPKSGRVVILSSADMMKTEFLQMRGDYQNNLNFFYNTIESFGLDERLMQIRRKEVTARRFKPGTGEGSAVWINLVNIALLPAVVGIFGLTRFLVRRADANKYERQYQIAKSS